MLLFLLKRISPEIVALCPMTLFGRFYQSRRECLAHFIDREFQFVEPEGRRFSVAQGHFQRLRNGMQLTLPSIPVRPLEGMNQFERGFVRTIADRLLDLCCCRRSVINEFDQPGTGSGPGHRQSVPRLQWCRFWPSSRVRSGGRRLPKGWIEWSLGSAFMRNLLWGIWPTNTRCGLVRTCFSIFPESALLVHP